MEVRMEAVGVEKAQGHRTQEPLLVVPSADLVSAALSFPFLVLQTLGIFAKRKIWEVSLTASSAVLSILGIGAYFLFLKKKRQDERFSKVEILYPQSPGGDIHERDGN